MRFSMDISALLTMPTSYLHSSDRRSRQPIFVTIFGQHRYYWPLIDNVTIILNWSGFAAGPNWWSTSPPENGKGACREFLLNRFIALAFRRIFKS
jgi:hypothetical protein